MDFFYTTYTLYGAALLWLSLALLALLLLWTLLLHWRLSRLRGLYRRTLEEVAGSDLEAWLMEQRSSQTDLAARLLVLEAQSRTMQEQLTQQVGNVGVVRFNPYQDAGSDQSFAIAWLDEQANGVVLSSLHNRTGVRVYAKPLERGQSPYSLSEEEEMAIRKAKG